MIKHETWLNIAKVFAEESKCVSLHVGCVLVKDDRQISIGVNGTPRGFTNCNELFTERCDKHREWSAKYEVHAEMNSLLQCPVSTDGAIAYVTHTPCFNCCKHLIAAGVKEIHFNEMYHRESYEDFKEISDFCRKCNVKLVCHSEFLTKFEERLSSAYLTMEINLENGVYEASVKTFGKDGSKITIKETLGKDEVGDSFKMLCVRDRLKESIAPIIWKTIVEEQEEENDKAGLCSC